MENILVIGAHFDDAELGVGGTLAKLSDQGARVHKLTLTDDVTNFEHLEINTDFQSSYNSSLEACKILGINQLEPLKYHPCNQLKYSTEVMQMVEKIIFDLEIDTVFSHFPSDVQQDHVASSRITYVAARYCPRLLFYQSNRYLLPHDFYPRFFSDITSYAEKKFKALTCYKEGGHDRMSKLFSQTKIQNQIWGHQMSMTSTNNYLAEAFHIHKWVI